MKVSTSGPVSRTSAPLRVTVFDYGAGNLHSLVKTLETVDTVVHVEIDPERASANCDALVLPGVGAFTPAAERLAAGRAAMHDAIMGGLPCLGICLGMQLLFDASDEGPGQGLGVLRGHVTRIRAQRVPQIGWNTLDDCTDHLLRDADVRMAYYANSFVCRPSEESASYVTAWSEHEGDQFPAAVRRGMLFGTQFHPEKSSAPGVAFIHAFLRAALAERDAHTPSIPSP